MIKTTEFLNAMGFVCTTPQHDGERMKSCNVTELSFHLVYATANIRNQIRVGNVLLERQSLQRSRGRMHLIYRVFHSEPGIEVLLGQMEIYVRPVSKQVLVVLTPR